MHKSGFVNIVGNPNVGKSTLINALIGDKLSIISSKPQTTRHRILGILNDEEYQIIFSDSPGIIEDPNYELQSKMNKFAYASFEDADVMLFVTDIYERYEGDEKVLHLLNKTDYPKYLIVNKFDAIKGIFDKESFEEKWGQWVKFDKILYISAKENIGIEEMVALVKSELPEGPEYFPKDQWTDKTERFFVSEIMRAHLLQLYKQEIPYSCEVVVESFKEGESRGGPIINIVTQIIVERKTQKSIVIGKGGEAIKKLGTLARLDLEEFLGKKVFLEMHVTVREDWRNSDKALRNFGYDG